jgi:hypothetical protein
MLFNYRGVRPFFELCNLQGAFGFYSYGKAPPKSGKRPPNVRALYGQVFRKSIAKPAENGPKAFISGI